MLDGTPEEKLEAFDTFRAYCGSYAVMQSFDGQLIVRHAVETCNFPNRVGTVLARTATFSHDGATLTLRPVGTTTGEVLEWRKFA